MSTTTRTDRGTGVVLATVGAALAALMLAASGGCTSTTTTKAETPATRAVKNDSGAARRIENPAWMDEAMARDRLALETARATPPAAEPINAPAPSARPLTPEEQDASMSALAERTEALASELGRTELIERLATILADEARSSDMPIVELTQLAALETIEPGIVHKSTGSRTGGAAAGRLTPSESSFMTAWRDVHERTGMTLIDSGDVTSLAESFAGLADTVGAWRSLAIPRAVLCTKVDGYGLFEELRTYDNTYKLVAGRKHRLIVYCEIENFAHQRERRDGADGHRVELTQGLNLYLYSPQGSEGDVLAWSKPIERIVDFSINRRRDFFIVQIIELPETLTIGRYNLKVTAADETSAGGAGGAVPAGRLASALIPIEIVADASALKDTRGGRR